MPIYEGNENIWESYKERLEKEAELLVQPGRNPLLVMADFFPEAAYEISADVNVSQLYSAEYAPYSLFSMIVFQFSATTLFART